MRINAVNSLNSVKNVNNSAPQENRSVPSFKASLPGEAAKKMPWLGRALMYVGQNDGEILNTLVTAFGTAVIAPVFIAGNPISKEDKETKWYSAMRQPISAVIAMVMQIGVNNVYNDYMYKMASTGQLGKHMDLRGCPEAKYLRKIIQLEHPEYDAKQISQEITKRQHAAEKRMLQEFRVEMQGKEIAIDELVDSKALTEAEDELKEALETQHKSELEKMSSKQKEKWFKENITKEQIKERATKNVTKSIAFETEVKLELRKLKQQFMSTEGATIDDAIESVNNSTTLKQEIKERLIEKLNATKAYETANGKKAFTSIPDYGCKLEKTAIEQQVKIKKLLKVKISNAQKFFGKTKNIIGIVVSLATLPISCGLLNWAYPRVMEKVMPKLQPYIHRNDPDWTPEKAKKYGPPPKVVKVKVEVDDD